MNKQKGFTLVELLIVIIILGILAAYAVPKYMNIDKHARISVVKSLKGSLASGAEMVRAVAVANNQVTEGAVVNVGSTNVTVVAGGYPAANSNGIGAVISDTTGFTFNNGTYTKDGAPTPATCSVLYTANANASPSITVNTDGC